MRRLPPQQIEKNLIDLIDLAPALCEDLLSSVDQPLKIAKDKESGRDYLLCDYNRDGDSYRSPWSNTYDPPLEDGSMPSERLRKLEIEANHAFDQYRDMYYEGGVSSVYLWDLNHGFAGVILIKKAGDGSKKIKGCWDSIHVVEVQEKSSGRMAHYKLTSTAMLWLQTNKTGSGTMNLGGSLTRQVFAWYTYNIYLNIIICFSFRLNKMRMWTNNRRTLPTSGAWSKIWRTKFEILWTKSILGKRKISSTGCVAFNRCRIKRRRRQWSKIWPPHYCGATSKTIIKFMQLFNIKLITFFTEIL